MNKITEKIIEPSQIETGTFFKIKIKAIKYINYGELKKEKVSKIKQYTVSNLKGD